MAFRTRIESPPGGGPRRRFPVVLGFVICVASFGLVSPPAVAGDLEEYLREELLGCRGVLRIDVMKTNYEPNFDTFADILAEVPVGTWVNESGEVHYISPDMESGIRDPRTALLKEDPVRIVQVSSSRRATELTLALTSNPEIRARLEMRYSGSLRKNQSDVDRVWTALGNVLDFSPAPDGAGRCRKGGEEPGMPTEVPPSRPPAGETSPEPPPVGLSTRTG